jgi:holo-[acyl-carrier protein] synthase
MRLGQELGEIAVALVGDDDARAGLGDQEVRAGDADIGIEEALARYSGRFEKRCFTETERKKSDARAGRAASYAKRFAAKEAFAKALGTGVRAPATLTAIGVTHDDLGKPLFALGEALASVLAEKDLIAHLSISDEADYAVAYVILEKP